MRRKDHDLIPVIDDALRVLPNHAILDHKRIRAALPKARRFMLTDEASMHMGEIVRETEDLILHHQQFAIPPFETMYVELNVRLLYLASGKRTASVDVDGEVIIEPAGKNADGRDYKANPFSDNRVGYLIDRGCIWTFSRQVDGTSGIGPWRIEDSLGHADGFKWPTHIHEEARLLGPEWGPLALMLASGVHALDAESRAAIRARFSIHKALHEPAYDKWASWCCATGDVRNVIAVLLLLNTPQRIAMVAQQPRVVIASGRRMVYAAHRVVNIELGKVKDVRRLWRHFSDRESPRRHEVKGHYLHLHAKPGCSHPWPTMPDGRDPDEGGPRWTCPACGCVRVWRMAHERGDASKGWVTKDYEVVR